MTKNLYILTGASRGMGLAMAEQLLGPDNHLLCISRHTVDALTAKAAGLNCLLAQWPLDLQDGVAASERLTHWLDSLSVSDFGSATLINNAGVIPDIAPLSGTDPAQLIRALRVGLEAPMLMTGAFLRATEHWSVPRKVLNISSGLGRRAMASQTAYCAAKAGMDHFTRCLALEEAIKPFGAKVCSLAPGVIDTDMQVQLRSANATAFPDQTSFLNLHKNGQLSTPAEAAAMVLARLARADFGSQPVDDVRS
jgi:NAD(P)-dependent dehydrogenase (short-subunit alcohol dehydrogenase family)